MAENPGNRSPEVIGGSAIVVVDGIPGWIVRIKGAKYDRLWGFNIKGFPTELKGLMRYSCHIILKLVLLGKGANVNTRFGIYLQYTNEKSALIYLIRHKLDMRSLSLKNTGEGISAEINLFGINNPDRFVHRY